MAEQQQRGRIAIIGLGLIGGSLGKALRRAVPQAAIVGYDSAWGLSGKAERAGAIERSARSAEAAVRDAAMVIVATPISAVAEVFKEIAPALTPGAVVMDTASTKSQVVRWARQHLPPEVDFIGGHPMAGKETSGLDSADPDLFRDRAFVLVPSVHAAESSIKLALGVVEAVGARPVFMDADEHDSYVAAVSHVPLVAAAALFLTAHQSQAWPELATLASTGFLDTTRLASGPPEMGLDIARTNRDHLVHWLDRYGQEVRRLRDLAATSSDEELFKALAKASLERDHLVTNGPPGREAAPEVEKISLADVLIGGWAARKLRESQKMIEAMERGETERRTEM